VNPLRREAGSPGSPGSRAPGNAGNQGFVSTAWGLHMVKRWIYPGNYRIAIENDQKNPAWWFGTMEMCDFPFSWE